MDNSLPVCMKRLSFFNICVSPTIVVRRKIFPEFSLFLVNARYHSYQDSKVLATVFCYAKLVFWPVGQSNMHCILDFCPDLAERNRMYQKLKQARLWACGRGDMSTPSFGSHQRYTYRVLQTIQMKLILLCVWAEQAVLGSAKTVLKLKYEI